MQPKHILVIDHDGDIRDIVAALLSDLGYRVSVAKDAAATRAILDADGVNVIVLDASTSDMADVSLAIEAKDRGIRLVMISGDPKEMEAFHNRADQLLWKPFRRADLERAIQHAFASHMFGQRVEDPN
ncbi:MAG TPA: response regulator [Stellaceae bacterium]|nr:response regulator [Stellaceae bacterium]